MFEKSPTIKGRILENAVKGRPFNKFVFSRRDGQNGKGRKEKKPHLNHNRIGIKYR